MTHAYVDTSCLVAITFAEAGAAVVARRIEEFDALFASNLVEAELLAVCTRERVPPPDDVLATITWVIPDRPVSAEIRRVLSAAYVRGPDAWHLACALYLAPDADDFAFLTLDAKQLAAARALGFRTQFSGS